MLASHADVVEQCREILIPVGIYFHLIILEGQCPAIVREHAHQVTMLWWYIQVALLHKSQHSALGYAVQTLFLNETLATGVLTEKEIQDDTCHWHEDEHQQPGQGLGWLTVVHHHCYGGGYHYRSIYQKYYPVYVYHRCMKFNIRRSDIACAARMPSREWQSRHGGLRSASDAVFPRPGPVHHVL